MINVPVLAKLARQIAVKIALVQIARAKDVPARTK